MKRFLNLFATALVLAGCSKEPRTVKVTGVAVSPKEYVLEINRTVTLRAAVAPTDADNKTVSWSSDNHAVATVDEITGEVTPHSTGLVVITATTDEGGFTNTCTITVIPVPKPKPKPDPVGVNYLLGSLFGFEGDVRRGRVTNSDPNSSTTYFNLPLFQGTEAEWWDNLAEEYAYSGMDYAMANCRGVLPPESTHDNGAHKYTDHGDPTLLTRLIDAMERRGLADNFKIAIFDDCPASWAAARNFDLYGSYSDKMQDGVYDYPADNLDGEGGVYKYIWDYNIKLAFQTVPDKYQFKFRDRPVIFFWSVNNFIDPAGRNNVAGKLSAILIRLREDFKAEFNVDPYIIVDHSFNHRDNSVVFPVVDAMHAWFGMSEPYTYRPNVTGGSAGDATIGVAIPGFSINDRKGNKMFVDANHGERLYTSLNNLASANAELVLVEGFTDLYENAALWRSTDKTYYDYPNQRLNILRRFSSDPYPTSRKIEAETCDFFKDNSPGNSGGAFRKDGDIDIEKCTDTYEGWHVTDATAGEWLQWMELPFRAATTTFKLRYSSTADAEVRFSVDEQDCEKISLPSTGGEWKTIDAGTVNFDERGLHDLTLNIVSGTLRINFFNMAADK